MLLTRAPLDIVKQVNNDSPIVNVVRSGGGAPIAVDFTPPYKVLDITEEIEKNTGESLPDLASANAAEAVAAYCQRHGVQLPSPPHSIPRLIDTLVGHYVEPMCEQPTFLANHPIQMSPLAKRHPTRSALSDRVELFVAGKELVNAYSELNDPEEQRERFRDQMQQRANGDLEAQPLDEDFCRALEYGLPPTAGWGLGVDRLVMVRSTLSLLPCVLTVAF